MRPAQSITAALLLTICWQPAQADTQVIHAGTLLAVPGTPPVTEQSIIVREGRIAELIAGYVVPGEYDADAKLLDLTDSFVMPGLTDAHVHLQLEIGPNYDRDRLKLSDEMLQMRSVHFAEKVLMAGFTTVRDTGAFFPQEMYALRDGIHRGWIDGPRIFSSGLVVITGGHGGKFSGMKPDFMHYIIANSENICDGPYDCRRATRNVIMYGADWVKISVTGGVSSENATGTGLQMELDEIRAVVNAAKRMGRKVAAHAHEEDGIIAALETGVDSVEHGGFAGPRAIELFKETGAYLVPTLTVANALLSRAMQGYLPEAVRKKGLRVGTHTLENFEKVYKAGVKIASGTDLAMGHGSNASEAVLMHKHGMSEMDVLVTATINTADMLGMSDELGTIEVGKQADIIATRGSPLENIEELLDVDFVMKGGQVYKHK